MIAIILNTNNPNNKYLFNIFESKNKIKEFLCHN